MPKSPIEETLNHWLEAAKYFEQDMIDESTFLNAQAEAINIASRFTPTSANKAAATLTFVIFLWKEEIGVPSTPIHKAMDRMLESVIEFLKAA